MNQARVVVIGGGITGCSVAYHLAEAGWTDVLLVEKAQLTAGSTCQAAGLVTMFNPSNTMMRFRRYSVELYERLGVFERVGSVRLASSPEQLRELERTASRARGIGLDADVISADAARALMPAISPDSLFGGVHIPGDGHLDPHTATHAVADAARALGVRFQLNTRVTGFELSPAREIKRVLTDRGPIDAEIVVNAAGMWAPQVAAMVGAFVPSTPVDHQHVALKAVPGHELPRDMPCFRDPDNLVYGKSEHGGMVFGGYEAEPRARWLDGVPWDHAATSLPPDWERFGPLMAGAIRRFPFLGRCRGDPPRLPSRCDDPGRQPAAWGRMPGIRGFWMAAGLSLNGFGGGGGIGRALAGWITAERSGRGRGRRIVRGASPTRTATRPGSPAWRARPTPTTTGSASRTTRTRRAGRAACPRSTAGSRRRARSSARRPVGSAPTSIGPGQPGNGRAASPGARDGRDPIGSSGWGTSIEPFAERVGMIDLSSFGKIEVRGPAALGLLQRVCANDVDRPVGAAVYGQFLDPRGGMLADVTITRLADDHFRVLTGAGYLAADMGWVRANAEPGAAVEIRDVTDDLTVIGCWGPRARDVLALATEDDVSDAAIPMRTAREIRIGPRRSGPRDPDQLRRRARLGAHGAPADAVGVWDALERAAGIATAGLEPIGYRALDSLRLEKGFRYYGADLTMLDTPYEAGIGPFVRLGKGDFVGRDAAHRRSRGCPGWPDATASNGDRRWRRPGLRSTAARRFGSTARSSGDSAARPSATRSARPSGPSISMLPSTSAARSRSMCSMDVWRARWRPMCSHDPTGARMRG